MSDDMKPNPLQNLKAVAHMAEVSGLHIDDLRVMPAAGVADIVYEAKDRIEELEAKLAKAVDGLRQCEAEIDDYIRHEYPGDHPVQARYRKRDFDANPARTTLAELTGGKDERSTRTDLGLCP